jgi:hypothetical protein
VNDGAGRDEPANELEIAGALRAVEARWQRKARVTTTTTGEVETEELREREPEDPEPHRTYRKVRLAWRFGARLPGEARRRAP